MFRDGDSLNPTSIRCLVYKVFFFLFLCLLICFIKKEDI